MLWINLPELLVEDVYFGVDTELNETSLSNVLHKVQASFSCFPYVISLPLQNEKRGNLFMLLATHAFTMREKAAKQLRPKNVYNNKQAFHWKLLRLHLLF